jgi:hypothetical protein
MVCPGLESELNDYRLRKQLVVLCSGLETSELNDNVDAPRKEGRR